MASFIPEKQFYAEIDMNKDDRYSEIYNSIEDFGYEYDSERPVKKAQGTFNDVYFIKDTKTQEKCVLRINKHSLIERRQYENGESDEIYNKDAILESLPYNLLKTTQSVDYTSKLSIIIDRTIELLNIVGKKGYSPLNKWVGWLLKEKLENDVTITQYYFTTIHEAYDENLTTYMFNNYKLTNETREFNDRGSNISVKFIDFDINSCIIPKNVNDLQDKRVKFDFYIIYLGNFFLRWHEINIFMEPNVINEGVQRNMVNSICAKDYEYTKELFMYVRHYLRDIYFSIYYTILDTLRSLDESKQEISNDIIPLIKSLKKIVMPRLYDNIVIDYLMKDTIMSEEMYTKCCRVEEHVNDRLSEPQKQEMMKLVCKPVLEKLVIIFNRFHSCEHKNYMKHVVGSHPEMVDESDHILKTQNNDELNKISTDIKNILYGLIVDEGIDCLDIKTQNIVIKQVTPSEISAAKPAAKPSTSKSKKKSTSKSTSTAKRNTTAKSTSKSISTSTAKRNTTAKSTSKSTSKSAAKPSAKPSAKKNTKTTSTGEPRKKIKINDDVKLISKL